VRQAHRVALHLSGIRVGPGWVVGGLLAAALLSTGMVAGSTGAAAPTVRSGEASQAQLAAAVSSRPVPSSDPAGAVWVNTSSGVSGSDSPVGGQMVTTSRIGAAAAPVVGSHAPSQKATSRPKATARPTATLRSTATARPKVTPRPTAAPVTKPVTHATGATAPRLVSTPKPTPAIAYQHRVDGRATWGHFGGAVITRLPRGTRIRVCGRLGCWEGVSAGYGPSPAGGNLVDLDAAVFQRICGPLATGVGSVALAWR